MKKSTKKAAPKRKSGMKGGRIDKAMLPSRHVTEGPERAPHRSFYYAMGLTEKEIHQPFVGVATTWNEAAPCNITLGRQAQWAKKGVKAAGGTPREFPTITVTDGIAMGHQGMKSSLTIGRAHVCTPVTNAHLVCRPMLEKK